MIESRISQIVRANHRAAEVFKSLGINYCCGGDLPLQKVCAEKGIDPYAVLQSIEEASNEVRLPAGINMDNWKLGFLSDYIIHIHHAFLFHSLPSIEAALLSFASSHSRKFPELDELHSVFTQLSALLKQQIAEEQTTIFPYIRQLEHAYLRRETYGQLFVRTLGKPLAELGVKHRAITAFLERIRVLTNDFTTPEKACTNHTVVFRRLAELEEIILQQLSLEDKRLFPRAMSMEEILLQS